MAQKPARRTWSSPSWAAVEIGLGRPRLSDGSEADSKNLVKPELSFSVLTMTVVSCWRRWPQPLCADDDADQSHCVLTVTTAVYADDDSPYPGKNITHDKLNDF
jgi:hypothetical protein